MLTKIEILKLVSEAHLSTVSNEFIDQILRNFDDKDPIPKVKLEAIYKIIKAEEQANTNLAEGCDEAIKIWEEMNSKL